MSLRSFLGFERPFSYVEALEKYGLEELAQIMAIIVRAKFSLDPETRMRQVMQFVREEGDAMIRAGGYPASFAREHLGDPETYIGAMDEDAEFSVDYPGGPQQTLLQMTFDFMREAGSETDVTARFRCAAVGIIADIELTALKMKVKPKSVDLDKAFDLKRRVDEADKILGELIKKHKDYFRKFMRKRGYDK